MPTKHPAGLAAAFAGVSGGYSANLRIGAWNPADASDDLEKGDRLAPLTTAQRRVLRWARVSALAIAALAALVFVLLLVPCFVSARPTGVDSTTNIITPMMSCFGLILAFATRYVRGLGIGTLIATLLPCSIALAIGWTMWCQIHVFALGLPVGPGAPTGYPGPDPGPG